MCLYLVAPIWACLVFFVKLCPIVEELCESVTWDGGDVHEPVQAIHERIWRPAPPSGIEEKLLVG